ncbi:hypothetical protein YC2023_091987 [Brassica napus]
MDGLQLLLSSGHLVKKCFNAWSKCICPITTRYCYKLKRRRAKENAKRALGPTSETARPNRKVCQGGSLDTWSDLLHQRDIRRNCLDLSASASTSPEHHQRDPRSSELRNRQASNESITVLHRTVLTPESSIETRDLLRL